MKKIFLLFSIAVFLYLFTGCLEETSLFNADFPPLIIFQINFKVFQAHIRSHFLVQNLQGEILLVMQNCLIHIMIIMLLITARKLRSFSLILSIKMEKINVMNLRKLIY